MSFFTNLGSGVASLFKGGASTSKAVATSTEIAADVGKSIGKVGQQINVTLAPATQALTNAGKTISAGAVAAGGAVIAGVSYLFGGQAANTTVFGSLSVFDCVLIGVGLVVVGLIYYFVKSRGSSNDR